MIDCSAIGCCYGCVRLKEVVWGTFVVRCPICRSLLACENGEWELAQKTTREVLSKIKQELKDKLQAEIEDS